MEKAKRIIKRTCILSAIFVIYVLILYAFGLHCPIAYITGIDCPTCGISRALLSILKLDFKASFNYQPLAVPVVIAVWLLLNLEFFKHKKIILSISLSIVVLNFILYLSRIII
jgi:hypothetical protein